MSSSSPKYISIADRKRIAMAYLLIKAGGKPFSDSVKHHVDIIARAMGKRRHIYNHAKDWLEMQQSLEQDPGTPDEFAEVLLVHNEETGYTGSIGFNIQEGNSEDPYTQGMTEGFSLFGVGNAWRRPAFKGCPECEQSLNRRWNKVRHLDDCSQTEEIQWIANPALWNQDGEFIDIGDNRSILKYISSEEDMLSTIWKTNSSPCPNNHNDVVVQTHTDKNGEPVDKTINVFMTYNAAGILEPCRKCRGSGSVYPKCSFCEGRGLIPHPFSPSTKCPACGGNRNGERVEMTNNSSAGGREAANHVLLAIQQDVEDTELGLDFLTFMTNTAIMVKVHSMVRKDKRRQKNIDILMARAADERGGLTKPELNRLRQLKKGTPITYEWAWKQLFLQAVEANNIELDWLKDAIRACSYDLEDDDIVTIPWIDDEGGTRGLRINQTGLLKLQAISRVINWSLRTTAATSEQNNDLSSQLMNMFGGNSETWGPYRLTRELGDAELMIHKMKTNWSDYHVPTDTFYNIRTDTIQGYNPAMDMNRNAATSTVVNTIMDDIFPLIADKDLNLPMVSNQARILRDGRRPTQLTVAEITNMPELPAANAKLFRGTSDGDPIVAFKWKGAWFNLNRDSTGNWASIALSNFRNADGISCWNSRTLGEEGLHVGLALMATTILNNKKLCSQLRSIKNYMADQMVKLAQSKGDAKNIAKMQRRADLYRVAQLMYQWYPPNHTKGKRLPDLFYLRYSTNQGWKTVASRITDGAIFNKAKALCTANDWKWTEITEPRGQWTVRHVQCLESKNQIALDDIIAQWLDNQDRSLTMALNQFNDRMHNASLQWRNSYKNWHSNRSTLRTEMTHILGYTPRLELLNHFGPDPQVIKNKIAQAKDALAKGKSGTRKPSTDKIWLAPEPGIKVIRRIE